MFNFTTQTVYNQISTTGANKNMWIATGGATPVLRIGNTRFDAATIESVEVKNPTVENLASVTFDMTDILIDQSATYSEIVARIAIYVGLSMASQDAFYANALVYKGKPFFIEFKVNKTDSAADVARKVKAAADKYLVLTSDEKLLDVTINSGSVTISGVNGYQQIKKAALQKFDPEANKIDCCSYNGEFVDVIVGVPAIYTTDATGAVTLTVDDEAYQKLAEDGTAVALAANEVPIAPGIEAFGDYNWIIHNLRLPTAANTGFWAVTKEEMPAVGQQYTQFIVTMAANADGIASGAVGQRVTSVTTHVLYVAGLISDANSAAKKVSDAFFTSGGLNINSKKKTTADTVLVDPFGQGA